MENNTWTGLKSACSRVNNHGMGRYSTKLDSDMIFDNEKKTKRPKITWGHDPKLWILHLSSVSPWNFDMTACSI